MLTTSYPRYTGDMSGRFIHNLAKELVNRNIEVKVVCPQEINTNEYYQKNGEKRFVHSKFHEFIEGVEIFRFKYMPKIDWQKLTDEAGIAENIKNSFLAKIQLPFFIIFAIFNGLKVARKCDLIHAHWALSGLVGVFIKKINSKPVYLTVRGSGTMLMPKFVLKFVFQNVDLVNVDVLYLKRKIDELSVKYNHTNVKIKYIDEKKYNSLISGERIIKEFGLKNKIVISTIGRFVPVKGIDFLIKAIPLVVKEVDNIVFLIVGDGLLREEYEKLVQDLQITDFVIFTGIRNDINEILAASTIFVSTSKFDNCFSNVILEAMTCGVPCIISDEGDTNKFWIHQHDSILYERNDEKNLARSMIKLIKDKHLAEKLKLNGPEFIKKYGFTKEKMVLQTIQNYKKICGEI
jgi:glycosyltransferase involved in cell wall biosynthesis